MADSDTDRRKAQATLMKACALKLTGVIRGPECPATEIRNELKPSDSFDWSSKLVQLVGAADLNATFLLLRQSKLPKKDYRELRGTISPFISDNSQICPSHREIWRDVVVRYELVEILPVGDWVSIVAILETAYIPNPDDLAALSRLDAMAVCDTVHHRGKIMALWIACKCLRGSTTRNTGSLQHLTKPTNMLAESIKGETIEETDIYLSYQEYKEMLQLEPNFGNLTPTKRTERISDPLLDRNIVDLLLKTGEKLNISRSSNGPLPSSASGIKNDIRFCKLVRRSFSPVAEETVKLWPSTFNPEETFKNCLAHLQKACFLLNLPTDWITAAVLTFSAGLGDAQVRPFEYPNLIRRADLVLLLDHTPPREEFAHLLSILHLLAASTIWIAPTYPGVPQ